MTGTARIRGIAVSWKKRGRKPPQGGSMEVGLTKDIKVTVKSVQRDDAGEVNCMEVTAAGEYYFKNGSHYIFYEEADGDSGGKIRNSLKLKGNVLELTRKGVVNSRMAFEAGKKYAVDYATPFGALRMETATSALSFYEEPDCIRMMLEYELWMDQARVSVCGLTVTLDSI